ncbi:MAG TPA: sialate O-acetylesterase [Rariglobus sp.]|nr:sialate O-acetylesterase [Rariglobus sp.]
MAAPFGDHMVLQRDVSVNIWGSAAPGEVISLSVDGHQEATATAGADGRWKTQLRSHPAGGPHEVTLAGKTTQNLHDVLFGDVWLLAGQSNMDFTSQGVLKPEVLAAEKAKADHAELRYFSVGHPRTIAPLTQGAWKASAPDTMPSFSATGYFFGRTLLESLKVPIGLINAPWSGQRSESFTSLSVLEKIPAFAPLQERWAKFTADYPAAMDVYEKQTLPKWQAQVDEAKKSGQPAPKKPQPPKGGPDDENRPGTLFERMIAPLIPVTIKGVAWYQGESNADNIADAIAYRTMFPAMINDWRARWGWDVPFVFVQLANFRAVQTEPAPRFDAWPYARESQTLALRLPATGMSLTIDLNDDPKQIHPADKVTTGTRLAQVALAKVYGQQIPHTGPLYQSLRIEGARARILFTNVSGALRVRDGGPIKGFAIAGADQQFHWADARVDGSSVVVSSSEVAAPVMVRYDWADNPIGNLYDSAGLPAAPFRTDTIIPGQAVIPLLGKVITLRASNNGKYVASGASGSDPLVNSATSSEQAERFTVIDRGYGNVTLQAASNGKYAQAIPSGAAPIRNISANLGNYETFELLPCGKNTWSLCASSNHKYVSADPQGQKPLMNDSATVGAAQSFEITVVK